jgi:hypothetical protein
MEDQLTKHGECCVHFDTMAAAIKPDKVNVQVGLCAVWKSMHLLLWPMDA